MRLTCALYECLEGISRGQAYTHLVNRSVIIVAQHDFIVRIFYSKNLSLFLNEMPKRFDSDHRVKLCNINFQNPFDSVRNNKDGY